MGEPPQIVLGKLPGFHPGRELPQYHFVAKRVQYSSMWTIDQEIDWQTMWEPPLASLQKPVVPSMRSGQTPPAVAILGVPFDALTLTTAVEEFEKMIASRQPHYLVTANVDFLVQARRDPELRRILIEADVVLVSFGCPKAEKWMAMHYQSLGVPVVIGVGGTIDFLAGSLRRAPLWMQRCGTEWLFRLLQEPRRLARRYGSDLWDFSRAIF